MSCRWPAPPRAFRFERLNEVRNARPGLRPVILHYGEALLAQTFQTVSCNAMHPVEARCCRWILSMHDRADEDTLPLTHEFLAEMLGVQRSTVSVVTRTLQTAGLIRQSRGSITVIDRAGSRRDDLRMLRPDPPNLPAPAARHVSLTGLILDRTHSRRIRSFRFGFPILKARPSCR